MKRTCFAVFTAAICLLADKPGWADSRTPHSWKWPLYEPAQDSSGNLVAGRPRRLIFQSFGDLGDDLHMGIDIGANHDNVVNGVHLPDVTIIPVDSKLTYVFDHNDCAGRRIHVKTRGEGGMLCRIWFMTTDEELLYYFGHTHYDDAAVQGDIEVNSHLREAIVATLAGGTGGKPCPAGANCNFSAGDLGSTISDWAAPIGDTPPQYVTYNHLHMTIVDRKNGYDNLNPLIYLATTAAGVETTDSVAPVLDNIDFVPDQYDSSTASVVAQGTCGPEIKGIVDISAAAWDTFRSLALEAQSGALPVDANHPVYGSGKNMPYKATYTVTSLATAQVVQSGTWYEFDKGPMFCPGPSRGNSCVFPELKVAAQSDADYYQKYLSCGGSLGGPQMGILPVLDSNGVCTTVNGNTVNGFNERLYRKKGLSATTPLIVTNEWGTDDTWGSDLTHFYSVPGLHTNWNTTDTSNDPKFGDGRYQVDVVVYDYQGHSAGKSRIIRVHNKTGDSDLSGSPFSDIWLADSDTDIGAVPSNVGGQPYWESPDILVVAKATDTGSAPDPSKRVDQLIAGQAYHVWVQVHYGLCNSISGVKVALASANPSTFNSESSWKWITTPSATFVGTSGYPNGVSLPPGTAKQWVGPFDWIPGADEIGTDGHRCLLAGITSDKDATNISDMTNVPGHNNIAQRNIQIGKDMAAFKFMNPFSTSSQVALRLSSPDITTAYKMTVDYDASFEAAWTGTADVGLAHVGADLILTVGANDVGLPAVTLPGYAEKSITLSADGAEGSTITIRMTENVNGSDVGGVTMVYTVPPIVY